MSLDSSLLVVCCSVLQCVVMCCSVLQCVAAWCSVLQWVAMGYILLQRVAVCCRVSKWEVARHIAVSCMLQCVAGCHSVQESCSKANDCLCSHTQKKNIHTDTYMSMNAYRL